MASFPTSINRSSARRAVPNKRRNPFTSQHEVHHQSIDFRNQPSVKFNAKIYLARTFPINYNPIQLKHFNKRNENDLNLIICLELNGGDACLWQRRNQREFFARLHDDSQLLCHAQAAPANRCSFQYIITVFMTRKCILMREKLMKVETIEDGGGRVQFLIA